MKKILMAAIDYKWISASETESDNNKSASHTNQEGPSPGFPWL
jgi:hypothetical protein